MTWLVCGCLVSPLLREIAFEWLEVMTVSRPPSARTSMLKCSSELCRVPASPGERERRGDRWRELTKKIE